MSNIKIEITGERGMGKTVTAIRIVKMLRDLGMEVEYQGQHGLADGDFEDMLVDGLEWAGSEPRTIAVVDRT